MVAMSLSMQDFGVQGGNGFQKSVVHFAACTNVLPSRGNAVEFYKKSPAKQQSNSRTGLI
jgi:hypothetical protein